MSRCDFCSTHTVGVAGDDIMFHFLVCLFVCLCECVYVCHDDCPDDLTMKDLVPRKQYFAGTLSEMSSCASYVSRTHGVIDDVTRWQNRSKFEIDISPSIFSFRWKSLSRTQNGGYFENFEILHSFYLTSDMKRSSQIMSKKYFSLWWRHWWRHRLTSNSARHIPL